MEERVDLKENNTWKTLVKYSLPMTWIGIIDLLIVLVDFIWLYVFVKDFSAFAAVRISSTIVVTIESVTMGIIGALMVFIGQSFGAKQLDKVQTGIYTILHLSIICGIIVSILGLMLLPLLLQLFGVGKGIDHLSSKYLTYYFIGYVFLAVNNLLLLLPRYFGAVKLVRKALLMLFISNAILTPVIIILFTPIGMETISGAAAGTILAHLISVIYLLWKIFGQDELQLNLILINYLRTFDIGLIKNNLSFIFSQVFTGITFNLSVFLYIVILSHYSDEIFAVYSIASYAFILFDVFAHNFTASIIPIVSQNVGAKNFEPIHNMVRKMSFILLIYGLIAGIIIFLLKETVIHYLIHDAKMGSLTSQFINFYTIPWILNIMSFVFIFVCRSRRYKRVSLSYSHEYVCDGHPTTAFDT